MRSNNTYYKPIRISKTDDKLWDAIKEIRFKCQTCNHTVIIPAYVDKTICSHCKHIAANTSLAHFKYKLFQEIRKEKKDE